MIGRLVRQVARVGELGTRWISAFALGGALSACSAIGSPSDWFFDSNDSPPAGLNGKGPSAANSTAEGANGPYASSAQCKTCHAAIYAQWSESMHANALKSPLMIVQTALDMQHSLNGAPPEAKQLCVNCHGPVSALATESPALPFPGGDGANEGVSCVVCHSLGEAPLRPGTGGLENELARKVQPGRTYYGNIESPAGNSFHASKASPRFQKQGSDALCGSCHNVDFDRDKNGAITKGRDLVLQTTFDEYLEYRALGGASSCVDCHMQTLRGVTSAADLAPGAAPPRQVHDHSFTGVDFRLDLADDPQATKRVALLEGAAALSLETLPIVVGNQLSLRVVIQNRSGHALPTGFAFARQMWLEVVVTGAGGVPLFTSGVLARPADDLCDNDTLTDGLARFVSGCRAPDPNLVNFQLKLVDAISVEDDDDGLPKLNARGEPILVAAENGSETVLQFVEGGAVGRKRPATNEALAPLSPGERRTFTYVVPLVGGLVPGQGSLSVRLLFRSLPPYFLRAMDSLQSGGPRLSSFLDRLRPVEMASVRTPL